MITTLLAEAADLAGPPAPAKGFKVYEQAGPVPPTLVQGRRDYYKIVLVTDGDLTITCGAGTVEASAPFLFLANPHVPHTVASCSAGGGTRLICLFTEAFFRGRERAALLRRSPLTQPDAVPVVPLSPEQAGFLAGLYRQMLGVYDGEYAGRSALLTTALELLLHEVARWQPAAAPAPPKNAATRLADLFLALLERQFPIESTAKPLQARTAQDFAGSLAVHVNYLNRAVKEATGKPTSVHIAERVAAEAQALLQHTNWSVADIAYSLGFAYPTYFNNFFKRVTGQIPKTFRAAPV